MQIKLEKDEEMYNVKTIKAQSPIAIIKIEEKQYVWFSFKKTCKFWKPQLLKTTYCFAKQHFSFLLAERMIYEKLKHVNIAETQGGQEQGCVYDIQKKKFLVKLLPSNQFIWLQEQETDPILIIEYFETLNLTCIDF